MRCIVYGALPDSNIPALALTLCYRVNSTESGENPISVDALVSGVGKKTHGDVHLIIVAVLLCVDGYLKKSVEEKEGKRTVVASRRQGNENQATKFFRNTQRGPVSGF